MTTHCCADCGEEEGDDVNLKTCKACMLVKYCNAACQRNHWAKHKKECKQRAAELRDEALFKDQTPKEDCPICFLPMPKRMICCVSLPPATISSVPIYDFAIANDKLVNLGTENYFPCCGKSICGGCVHSFEKSGNDYKCPFCNSERGNVEQVIKRAEANDPASIRMLANYYCNGEHSFPQDLTKAIELYARAAELGFSQAHCKLGNIYYDGGDMKKAKFHFEAAAMAGNDDARCNLGYMDSESGNHQRGIKHYTIAASAGCFRAMHALRTFFEHGHGVVRRESIDSALTAYNDSCAEMRSEARDTYISIMAETK